MEATLTRKDELYHYSQKLNSKLFFLRFHQEEHSFFTLEQGVIHSKEYRIERPAMHGPSYEVIFQPGKAVVHCQEQEEPRVILLDDADHYQDRLVMQLVLIRAFGHDNTLKSLSVHYPDIKGRHEREYFFEKTAKGYQMHSSYRNKASSFELSPEHHFFPSRFQQYHHDNLVFEGEISSLLLGPSWEAFSTSEPVAYEISWDGETPTQHVEES